MRLGARILASLLLVSLYLPVGVAQATTGDTFAITGLSGTEVAGVADTNVTLTALLSDGTSTDTGYTGTVHFTSTDSAAVLPPDLVFNGSENGTQNFDVTFETSGTQTVTATDTLDSAITGGASTLVSAAAAFSVDLSANSTAALTSGVARGITATVTDSFGNDVVGQAVVFDQPGGTGSVSGTGSHSTDSSGVATDTVTGDQVGTVTVRGTANGHSGTVDFSVVAGPLDHVVLSPSTSTISPGGSQAYATEAFDAADNSLGDVSGTATLGITPNGSCTAPDCSASVAGAHTVTTSYGGKTDTATLTVGNNPPVANDDSTTVLENAGSTGVDVRANDTDADSDPLTVVSVSNPPHGTASVDGDSLGVHYQPDANYSGADSFTYTITDGTDTASATVNVTVTWVNQAPTFAKGADQNVLENVGAKSVSGWATAISPGPGNGDVGQTVHFNVTGDTNPSLFSAVPAISATGTLTEHGGIGHDLDQPPGQRGHRERR
jgi:Bacterial Ig domain/Bacterial Ig-like domain (group 1)